MKVESIAECILQNFWPTLSKKLIFGLFEWSLKAGFTVYIYITQ